MSNQIYTVLFLCTGNSARSILAEAILNKVGTGRFQAYSAGSHPVGRVHPLAMDLLEKNHHSVAGLRSKSWNEFSSTEAPRLDFVVTVCDNAAGEACPYWPGQPLTAHWGMPDPAAVESSEEDRRQAFFRAYRELSRRIELFTALPIAKLDKLALVRHMEEIGKEVGTS